MYGTDPIYNACDVLLRPGIDVPCATRAAPDRPPHTNETGTNGERRMARTQGRGDTILKVPELLTALGEMRGRRIKASMDVRPYGPAYHVVSMVVRAIDALATFVTGQRDYFDELAYQWHAFRGAGQRSRRRCRNW